MSTASAKTASVHTEAEEKQVLHVGCGMGKTVLKEDPFKNGNWKEIRLDIDPDVNPDIVADMRDMAMVESGSMDALWSSHNLEHVYPHETTTVLNEFFRVLKEGGFVYIMTPDLQTIAEHVAEGNLDEPLYSSPAGPISAIDMLYGHRASLSRGRFYMAHKNGFTALSLGTKLRQAGFYNVHLQRQGYNLHALAYKVAEEDVNKQSGIRVTNRNQTKDGQKAVSGKPATKPAQQRGPGLPDDLDRAPTVWNTSGS